MGDSHKEVLIGGSVCLLVVDQLYTVKENDLKMSLKWLVVKLKGV